MLDEEFDYETFDPDTRRLLRERAEQIRGLARVTISGIVEIGKHLTEAKEQLRHGQFLRWIEAEFGWSERKAENFMTVYARFKSANFAGLQINVSALYLIAAPSTPEPVRAEAVRRAENGEHVSHREVRALLRRVKETGEPAEVAVTPPGTITEQRPQTPRPPNKRQREHGRVVADRLVKEIIWHLEGFTTGLRQWDLEPVTCADSFDWASAIRSVHNSIKLIAEFEKELTRAKKRTRAKAGSTIAQREFRQYGPWGCHHFGTTDREVHRRSHQQRTSRYGQQPRGTCSMNEIRIPLTAVRRVDDRVGTNAVAARPGSRWSSRCGKSMVSLTAPAAGSWAIWCREISMALF